MSETTEQLRGELDRWRERLDSLRVQANLGKRELKDKLHEFGQTVEPVQQRARKRLSELAESGAGEAKAITKSLLAGWDELLRTHRELTRKDGKRSGQ